MSKLGWFMLLIFCMIGTLADGFASATILMSMLHPRNILAQVIVVVGGIIITGLAVCTKLVWDHRSPLVLKIIHVMAILIDVYTTIVGTIFYVIIGAPLSEPVDLSRIIICNPNNLVPTLLAFLLTAIITGSSVTTIHVFNLSC